MTTNLALFRSFYGLFEKRGSIAFFSYCGSEMDSGVEGVKIDCVGRLELQRFAKIMAVAAFLDRIRKFWKLVKIWVPPDCKACYTSLRDTPCI